MTKTLLDLLKACINATLLLLALCLFLGWKLMSSVDNVTGQVTQAVVQITPVQNRIEALRTEVAALRSDILQRPEIAVSAKLDALDRRLAALQSEMLDLKALPAELIHDAAQTAAVEFAGQVARLSNCVPPSL